jgi:FixJ family two-component response regulator
VAEPGVVFLDDDKDLRDLFAEVVALLSGRDCLTVSSLAELIAHEARVLAADLAILDINLGPDAPSGLDAYHWLRQQGFTGRIVFLTGHAASHPLVAEAHQLGDVRVFEKPLPIPVIAALLSQGAPA